MDFEKPEQSKPEKENLEEKVGSLVGNEELMLKYIESAKEFLAENKQREESGRNIFSSILLMLKNNTNPAELKENPKLLNIDNFNLIPKISNAIKLQGKIGELNFSMSEEEIKKRLQSKEKIKETAPVETKKEINDRVAALMHYLKTKDYESIEEREEIEKEITELQIKLRSE